MPTRENLILIYGIYLLVLSVLAFAFYAIDKRLAQAGRRRISEKFLLTISVIGGAVGGFLAMQLFRHKTKGEHWYFSAINVIGILAHAFFMYCVIFVFTF